MREVYISMDSASVGLREALLKEAGIESYVQNENLSRTVNAFIGPFQAKLVVKDEDYDAAMEVLVVLKDGQGADWTCPACKESVPGSFDSCWKCNAPRPAPGPPPIPHSS
jgi:hypothetical protein